ncbi:MAG: hypothetical protein H6599_01785 [Flavobacteriales bacterium]|nr:hypothetical protein [Flavobacteriales bacterium]
MIKQLKTLVLATTVGVSVVSCSKEPTACFTLDSETINVGESVVCDGSCSENVQQWKYTCDSDDAVYSGGINEPYETITFNAAGTFTITLEVENGNKLGETTRTITVQ